MKESYRDGVSHQAVDTNQLLDLLSGYGVIAGGKVTEGADPYHVEVESVNAYFDGSTQSPGATTIDLQNAVDSFNPRKVLICVDNTGSYIVKKGEPEQAKPRGKTQFQTNRPAYPDLHDVTGVIPLAGVWLGSSAEDIVNDDIEDRRRSPDVTLRNVTVENLIARTGITDGAGVDHEGELADSSDVTDTKIRDIINTDTDHGSTAPHNYFTDVDARDAVEETTDAADLSGAIGSDGQHLVTDGTNPFWQDMPGPENNQSLDTGDDVTFNSVTQQNATVNNQLTWPDGTVTTASPEAQANNITQFPELGDISVGTFANRQSPDGTQGWYFTTDSNGVYYDTGTWTLIAEHPGNIDPNDLGFDPVTQSEGHVTVSSGTHLSGGGQVDVGGTITLNIDETSLDTFIDNSYVKEGTELDNLAITHGGDSLDGTYTIPQGDAIELNNGWQLTDDGSGNIVLNKGSGDGYEFRVIKQDNGLSRVEIDGFIVATRTWANGQYLAEDNGRVVTKVHNETVNGGHPDFSSAQDAIDWGSNNGYHRFEFPSGIYDPITISQNSTHVEAKGRGGGLGGSVIFSGSSPGITIDAPNVTVKDCSIGSTNSNALTATPSGDNFVIDGLKVTQASSNGIYANCTGGSISSCNASSGNISLDDIRLGSDSSGIVATGNFGVNISDNGTNNAVGVNA